MIDFSSTCLSKIHNDNNDNLLDYGSQLQAGLVQH